MKRLVFLTALILFCSTSVFFAQESEKDYVDEQNMTVSEVEELIQSQSMINKIDFVFGVEPVISINTHTKSDGKFISAPSPIHFPVYIGLSIPNYTAISFQPTLRFFMSYNLVYDDMVLPAEVENRTGLTFNFLVNLPIVFKLNYNLVLVIGILSNSCRQFCTILFRNIAISIRIIFSIAICYNKVAP